MDSGNSPPVETPRSEFSCKNFVFELYHYLFFFDFVFKTWVSNLVESRTLYSKFRENKENHDVKKIIVCHKINDDSSTYWKK